MTTSAVEYAPAGALGFPGAMPASSTGFARVRIVTIVAYVLFLVSSLLYYFAFVHPYPDPRDAPGDLLYYSFFYYPVNYDYPAYIRYFVPTTRANWREILFAQNASIGHFYYALNAAIPVGYNALAFAVNHVCWLLTYFFGVRLMTAGRLSTKYAYLFFLNPQLLLYTQLITKEAPTLLFVVLLTYLAMTDRTVLFVVIALVAAVLRFQLLFFAAFLFLLRAPRYYRWKLALVYLASAAGSVLLAVQSVASQPDTLSGAGFSGVLLNLNARYYVGSLLLSPVKIVQYIYEQLLSFWFITPGHLNLYLAKDVPMILLLAALARRLSRITLNIGRYRASGERVLLSAIIAFMFMLLVNPVVHQRYLFPAEVLLVMLGLGSRRVPAESVAPTGR